MNKFEGTIRKTHIGETALMPTLAVASIPRILRPHRTGWVMVSRGPSMMAFSFAKGT